MAHVPDAWDDDYEVIVDNQKQPDPLQATSSSPAKISRAERKAKHVEENKTLWNSAENPETFHFIDSRNSEVPLKSDFKPAFKVLSRKPKPNPQNNQHAGEGLADSQQGLDSTSTSIEPCDDYDSEEEARREQEKGFREKQMRTKREREEKQRKYDEVRQRLFGAVAPTSGSDPNKKSSGDKPSGKNAQQKRGETLAARHLESSPKRPLKQLFDPSYSPKPNSSSAHKNRNGNAPAQPQESTESQILRNPRGPQNIGRNGAGFVQKAANVDGL